MSARVVDLNGWYTVKGNPLSKVGVFDYTGASIGAPDKSRIYKVYRPAEELADPECIESFKLLPWVDEHHMLGDGPGYMPAEKKGVHGVIGEDVYFDADAGILRGNLKVFSKSHAAAIDKNKPELSCGYRCTYDFTPGEWNGVKYDVVQRQMRGNHLASVKEGRMGPDVAVLDHLSFAVDGKLELEPVLTEQEKATLAALLAKLSPEEKATLLAPAEQSDEEKAAALAAANAAKAADMETPEEKAAKDAEAAAATADEEAKAAETAAAADAADKRAAATDAKITALTARVAAQDAALKARTAADAAADAAAPAAMDAKALFAAVAVRDRLAAKVKPFIGAFDHAEMTGDELAKYALDKLGVKDVPAGQEMTALDAYLAGRNPPKPVTPTGQDGKEAVNPVAAYITGDKA